jgi:predicted Zn-dependent peptidase
MAVFSGRSGRFYRPLVEEKKLAVGADAGYGSLRHGGIMHVGASPRPGVDAGEVEKALLGIVEEVRAGGVTDRELEKVRNQQMADLLRGMKTSGGIAQQLGYFEVIGTWRDLFAYVKSLQAVTGADVKRCAEKYLRPEGRIILTVKRKGKKP